MIVTGMVSVDDILVWTGGRLANASELGAAAGAIAVSSPARLRGSKEHDIAFFFSTSFKDELSSAVPGVLVTGEAFVKPLESSGLPLWKKSAVIVCADPYLAMAVVSGKIATALSTGAHIPGESAPSPQGPAVHPSTVLGASVSVGEGVRIGPNCVIEAHVRIGARTVLYPGCYVGLNAIIGQDSVLFPNVTIYENVELGNRVRLHAGVVIGADGFGYAPVREGDQVVNHQKIYHVGNVVIGDDVEIGANSCVDRATFGSTHIASKVKIDNLVQIGHNVQLEEGAVLCGCSACAGSSSVGKFAYVGGGAGIANQVHIGDRANVGAFSLVTKDVTPGETVIGNPMRDYKEYFRVHAMLSRLLAERKKGRS
ncbi:MAG TPA: UDP-3-O-(3-hydroxymyristoyl)glucosamine N-acyltransferase [Bdellovibrionales bacterium]|nr:MAG: hypothetical protein A2Z97_09680 [Bdellovibrionales bacterium GWB1_52_6]OFZ03665.1 MAG: hypothetical protein A2X97_01055 [Bdellovibrionales bacterium GWA1_52_35]OFZ42554.1 MAG: hypothetical protein A2070_12595 [Bdellovibrionales bacterium GWC1_52_8]HAR44299.1 UDP-3-O-(3-hydroxymyristoyl)glucosamine N-acyltransferase [Bdellovibrionales bacterium]HCM40610.1 UDP-3-O-(3-hydroxymyristoyl)glucosamine N-acyltransferase [Bdellovibrionales bacterium]